MNSVDITKDDVGIPVSIIIPVYNSKPFLREMLDSVYNQTFHNYEVIAVDDGSTDGSYDELVSLKKVYPGLVVLRQENRGPGGARNTGLSIAKGKYVYFLDSDDIIDSHLIEKGFKLLETHKCDFMCFQADIFGNLNGRDEQQYKYIEKYLEEICCYYGIDFVVKYYGRILLLNIPFTIYRREFLLKNNLSFMEGVLYEDVEFYYHMMAYNPKFIVTKDILYHRRYRAESIMTSAVDRKRLQSKIKVYEAIYMQSCQELKETYAHMCLYNLAEVLKQSLHNCISLNNDDLQRVMNVLYNVISSMKKTSLRIVCEIARCYRCLELTGVVEQNLCTAFSLIKERICGETSVCQLNNICSKIAIYGTGQFSAAILEGLEYILEMSDYRVTYLDTFLESGKRSFRGNMIMNYKDVDLLSYDNIIILSELYDKEIEKLLIDEGVPRYRITNINRMC